MSTFFKVVGGVILGLAALGFACLVFGLIFPVATIWLFQKDQPVVVQSPVVVQPITQPPTSFQVPSFTVTVYVDGRVDSSSVQATDYYMPAEYIDLIDEGRLKVEVTNLPTNDIVYVNDGGVNPKFTLQGNNHSFIPASAGASTGFRIVTRTQSLTIRSDDDWRP